MQRPLQICLRQAGACVPSALCVRLGAEVPVCDPVAKVGSEMRVETPASEPSRREAKMASKGRAGHELGGGSGEVK